MDYQQIESFLAITKTGSMNQAAEALYISQPTLTYRLRKLEQELGYQLFVRKKGQHVTFLTAEGSTFLPIAERWKAAWDETNAFKATGANIQIRIAATTSLNGIVFPLFYQKLRRFTDTLEIRSYHSHEIYTKLFNQEFDIGFIFHETAFPDTVTVPLYSDKMRLICHGLDIDNEAEIHPMQLHPSNEIFVDWGIEYRRWHSFWFGDSARPHIRIDSTPLMEYFFSTESSWAFVPDSLLARNPELKPFVKNFSSDTPPDRVCCMVTNVHRPIRDFQWGAEFLDELESFLTASPWLRNLYSK